MILILGSNHDDIVYFESVIKNKKSETILGKYNATIGTLFNQSVMLLCDIHTHALTASLITHIINKYFVLLVFCVGNCQCATNDLLIGDIAISKRILFGDINLIEAGGVELCQIPSMPKVFEVQQDVLLTLESSLSTRTYSKFYETTFISADVIFKNKDEMRYIREDDYILGYNQHVVFDNNSAGLALAGNLCDIPFISIKVVGNILGKKSTTDDYLVVLKQYASIGRAVVSAIGEISRNDVVRE